MLDGVTIALSWKSPYASGDDRMSWSYVACMLPLHGLLYALAVLGVCGLRRPVRGAMCAILPFFLLTIVLETLPRSESFDPIFIYDELFEAEMRSFPAVLDLSAHHYPLVYGAVVATSVLAALLAFRAIRHRHPARG